MPNGARSNTASSQSKPDLPAVSTAAPPRRLRAVATSATPDQADDASPGRERPAVPTLVVPTGGPVVGSPLAEVVQAVWGFARRRISGNYVVDGFGFDADLTNQVVLRALRPWSRWWLRAHTSGIDSVPAQGGALLWAPSSAATPVAPWVALMVAIVAHDQHPAHRPIRIVAFDERVFSWPLVGDWARKTGHLAAREHDQCADVHRALAGGELVLVVPHGTPIDLSDADTGMVDTTARQPELADRRSRPVDLQCLAAAVRAQVPIVRCAVAGARPWWPLSDAAADRLAAMLPWWAPLMTIPSPAFWWVEFTTATLNVPPTDAEDPHVLTNLAQQLRDAAPT